MFSTGEIRRRCLNRFQLFVVHFERILNYLLTFSFCSTSTSQGCFFPFLHEMKIQVHLLSGKNQRYFSSPHLATSAVIMFVVLNWHSMSTVGQLYFCPVQSVCLFICVSRTTQFPESERSCSYVPYYIFPLKNSTLCSLKTLAPETD